MSKLCESKYRDLGLTFPLEDYPETSLKTIEKLNGVLNDKN